MDELERDLRSTFDRLAEGAVPSADLVERTVARSVRIRRNRRIALSSGIAAALAAVITVASVAGAATHGHVNVSTPRIVEPVVTSTTATEPSPTTTVTIAPPD